MMTLKLDLGRARGRMEGRGGRAGGRMQRFERRVGRGVCRSQRRISGNVAKGTVGGLVYVDRGSQLRSLSSEPEAVVLDPVLGRFRGLSSSTLFLFGVCF